MKQKIYKHKGQEHPLCKMDDVVTYQCDTEMPHWHMPILASKVRWRWIDKSKGNIITYKVVGG